MSAEQTSKAALAAEQLCAALWEALRDRLSAGEAEEAAVLGERIAEVSLSVSALARARAKTQPNRGLDWMRPDGGREAQGDLGGGVQLDSERAVKAVPERAAEAVPAAASWGPESPGARQGEMARAAAGSGGALLVDEHAAAETSIAIRDARRQADASPWSIAVQRRLDRYVEDREQFAVMLLELLDAERLRLAQSPVDSERQVRDVEAAMVDQLRPADALVREADGRYWLIAPDTDAAAARAVTVRIANAARRSASHRGVPLEMAAGIAICPQHGVDVGALTGHAEVDLYAAESAGRLLSDPDEDPAA